MEEFTIQKSSGNSVLSFTETYISTKKIHNKFGVNIFILIFITLCSTTIEAQWVNVGPQNFSNGGLYMRSLAFNGSIPYVVFSDVGNGNKVSVMKFDGINWIYVGNPGFSLDFVQFPSIVFNGSTPYVVYVEYGYLDFKTTVMKFDGTSWVNVGNPRFSVGSAYYSSIAFDGNIPYVAYSDDVLGSTVKKFDGTLWVNVGNTGFTLGRPEYLTLVINNNTPYVAYRDDGNGYGTSVMKFDGTNWVNIGIKSFSAGLAHYQSLAFNGSIPYVAYQDDANGGKTTVMKFDGTNWVNVGNAGFSLGNSFGQSLAFNNNKPYVAFADNSLGNKTTVMRYNGFTWLNVGTPGFSAASTAAYKSLVFNGNEPYVAYSHDGTTGYGTNVVKFESGICPFPAIPALTISNATLNGVPISLNCGSTFQIINDPSDPNVLEFDITATDADLPADYISMGAILPDANCKIIEFNPVLPIVASNNNITSHITVTPNPLSDACLGTLIIFVSDSCGNERQCVINFDNPLPVELSSFNSSINQNNVTLNWITYSELNNARFEIERAANNNWQKVGEVSGNSNSSTPKNYTYTDRGLNLGTYSYRLKQVDYNGNFEYHNLYNKVIIGVPDKFELEQNYPNPFNPTTKIDYSIQHDGKVSLTIYDVMGKEITKLVNINQTAGYYSIDFNASNFASGIYYYRLEISGFNNFTDSKKMLFLK